MKGSRDSRCGDAASTEWIRFRDGVSCRHPFAELRLLATVTELVSRAGRGLGPDARADACEQICARIGAQIRCGTIRDALDLMTAIDAEIARSLDREASNERPARELLGQLRDALASLPEAHRDVLTTHHGLHDARPPAGSNARREALVELRRRLALDPD